MHFRSLAQGAGKTSKRGKNLFAKVKKHKHHRKEAMLCSVCSLIIGETNKIENILRAHAACALYFDLHTHGKFFSIFFTLCELRR